MEPPPAAHPSPRARKSGVVVPHRARWHQRILARLVWLLIRGVAATTRYRIEDRSGQFTGGDGGPPVIFTTWHNRLALSPIIYERHIRRRFPRRRLAGLVSASRDGALMARILELFQIEPVRGSSSRRGAQALLELAGAAERGFDLAVTPDGPRGPCYSVQPGVIAAAQFSGLAVVPVACRLSCKIRLRSWDRFQVPLPFTRWTVVMGEPLRVPREADDAVRERCRAELERRLRDLTRD